MKTSIAVTPEEALDILTWATSAVAAASQKITRGSRETNGLWEARRKRAAAIRDRAQEIVRAAEPT